MTLLSDGTKTIAATRTSTRAWIPVGCLIFATGALVLTSLEPRELSAASKSMLGPDFDSDGLADSMEMILGTSLDSDDTDGDGYDDIEEIARASDPLDPKSVPNTNPLSVGIYAYAEAGYFNLHAAVYVRDGDFDQLDFELGVVLKDKKFPVSQAVYSSSTRIFFYQGVRRGQDRLVILEMPIPDDVVTKVGSFGLYSLVRDRDEGSAPREPAIAVTAFTEINGFPMEVIPAPRVLNKGGGIVYRPLTGEGAVPSSSSTGQICWQGISAVGTSGASILFEVDSASCEDFDSFCGGSECSASVGKVIGLPDPGTLLGG